MPAWRRGLDGAVNWANRAYRALTEAGSAADSAELFGEQRDFWWNRDFLDLMAARWRLQEADSLADIGCGLGDNAIYLAQHGHRVTALDGFGSLEAPGE